MKTVRGILCNGVALTLLLSGVFLVSFLVGCASGQPHMRSALDHLFAAKGELQTATSDKGGHRVRAIELIDEAVGEVERGMEHARNR